MNWIKQNSFLSGLIAVTVIGAIALTYFLMKQKGKLAEAKEEYATAVSQLTGLQRKAPFPSEENAEELRGRLTAYRTEADELRRKMLAMQAPLPEGVRTTKFSDDLKTEVESVVSKMEMNGFDPPTNFYLGMKDYESRAPLEKAAARLQFQVNAISWLCHLLLDNDATMLDVNRPSQGFEKREAAPAATTRPRPGNRQRPQREEEKEKPVSEIYPLEVVFQMPPANFQIVMNALSNTKTVLAEEGEIVDGGEYYFVTRWVRLENSRPDAPPRSDAPEEEEEDEAAEEEEGGDEGFTLEAADDGPSKNMVFGQEQVRAYLALDLVRLIPESENAE